MPNSASTRFNGRWFSRAWRSAVAIAASGFLGLNAVAFLQARALTRYETEDRAVKRPRHMTRWEKAKALVCGVSVPRPTNRRTPEDLGLEYTVETFPGAHGLTLEAWRIEGKRNRPVVLLFPGYAAAKQMQLPPARVFHDLGCETWLVDFHGSGGSAGSTTTIGFDEAEDVAAAVNVVRERLAGERRPVVLFGTSMGAVAILRAVHVGMVQPDGIILECPFDRLLNTVENRFRIVEMPTFPLAHTMLFWGGVQRGFDPFSHNPVDYARSVRCPTLLMQGDQDQSVGLDCAKAVARSLGERGRFKVFEGLGHIRYSEHAPRQWRAAVIDLLAEVKPLPSRS